MIEDDKEPVVEVGVRGFAVDGSVLRQCGIRNGEQGCKIPEAVGGTLDTDLGDDGVFIMPTDENFPRAAGGGGEPGKRVLRL